MELDAIAILGALPGGLPAATLAIGLVLGALGAWLAMRGRVASERRLGEERLRAREEAEARLGDAFRSLSVEALQRNNAMFLDLARERLAQGEQRASGELERREQAVAALVAPVREALSRMDARLGELETRRAGAFGELKGEVERLAQARRCAARPRGWRSRCARRSRAGAGARCSCAASWSWLACWRIATSSSRRRSARSGASART